MPKKDRVDVNTKTGTIEEILELPIVLESAVSKITDTKEKAKDVVNTIINEEAKAVFENRKEVIKDLYKAYSKHSGTYNSIKPDKDPDFTSELVALNAGEKTYSPEQGRKKLNAKIAANSIVKALTEYLNSGDFKPVEEAHKKYK